MKRLITLLSLLIITQLTFGQLSGDKFIPGDYGTIAEAVTDLNAQGVLGGGGGVTFYVAAGHSETTTAPITILSTVIGSASDPIVFQKTGTGNNPLVTRTDGGTLSTTSTGGAGDAVIRIEGTDYVTFDGIDVASQLQGIEYGYLTHKPSGTDGCQFITIMNSTIDLTKGTSGYVYGIYIGNGTTSTSSATGVSVTAESGRNTNITITGNTIQDVHGGIYMRGSSAAAYRDDLYTIGQADAGNTIQNFGGGSATTTYGIYFIYVNNPSVEYNIIDNAGAGGSSHASSLYGIFYSTVGGDVKGNNNQFTLSNSSASSATQYIYNANTVTSNNFNNNTFAAGTLSSTGTVYLIYANSSTTNTTVSFNQTVGAITRTGTSGSFYCYYNNGSPASGSENFFNNNFSNINLSGSSSFYGIQTTTNSGHTQNIYNNTFSDITMGTGTCYGIYATTANTRNIYNNTVRNITSSSTIYGINSGSGASPGKIYNNKIHNLTSNHITATVYGIYVTSGTAVEIYNNYVYGLYAPVSGSTTGLAGIYVGGGTASFVYFNSIYLDASSTGANFGTSGIYVSVTPTVELRNNLVINNSVAEGTGYVVAYRRTSNTNLTTYAATSDNNDFYAGPPSASNLVFYDGTTPLQTIAEFKAFVAPRDANSFTENPPFVEVTTAPYDLHMKTDIATQCEGGGSVVSTVVDDFDGDLRQNPPDVGADEFEGTPAAICSGTPDASTIVGADEVCLNTGTVLELSTTYTDLGISYQWGYTDSPGGTLTPTGVNSPTLNTGNLIVNTYYKCTISCEFSGLSYITPEKAILVNPLPTVTVAPSSGSYCSPGGTPITLTASGALTYSWSPADGLDNTSSSVVNASPPSTTTYTVTGYDENGCSNTANVTVTVGNYPIISSVTATPDAICPNGTSQLNVVAIGPGPASQYSFAASGGTFVPITGGTTVPAIQADDVISGPIPIGFGFNFSGNNYGTVYASSNGFLSFNPSAASSASNSLGAPSTSIIPLIAPLWDDLDGKATGGSTASYLVSGSTGNRIFTFEWLNWEWYWNATSAVISFQVKLYETDNHIEFIYRQEAGNVVSGSASIGLAGTTVGNFLSLDGTGISPNASSTIATNNLAIKPASGQVYSFFLPVYTGYTYLWSPAAGLTPDATVPNPTTPSLAESTQYTVTVFNGDCSVQESVWVNLAEPLTAAATSPDRCTADVTTPITGSQTGGAPDFTFTWSPNYDLYEDAAGTIPYDGAANDSPTIYTKAYTSGFTYLLTVTDNCGTTSTATSTVTVYQTPTASAASNQPVCSGETLELYGTTDLGTSYEWTGPNGFTSGLLNPTIPDVTTAASGTYYFTATANDCPSAAASVTVVVNQTPSPVSINPVTSFICPGSIQQLDIVGGEVLVNLLSENFNGATSSFTIESAPTSPSQCNWYYQTVPYTSSAGAADFLNFSTIDGGKFAYSDSDAGGSGSTSSSRLISPVFSTVGFSSVNITFEHCYRIYGADVTVAIEISTDGGASWSVLKNYKGTNVGIVTNNAQATAPENISLDPSYLNQPNLMLRFNYISSWGYFWIVDNINISGTIIPSASWTPFTDLYLDAGAVTPYNGENVNTVYSKMFTSQTYTVTVSTTEGCSVTNTATVTAVDYTVSGTLKYNNNAKTPMNNVTLTLNPGGYTAITDGTGTYSFFDICAGDYSISITNINKPVGGINSTDAVQMNVWNANQPAIQHVKFLAGETNLDENTAINATDALAVQNYFVFATPFERTAITGSPWVLWKAGELVLGNYDANRLLSDISVSIVDSDVTVDLYGQAIGDFSGSFTPGNLKSESDNLELVNSGNRIAGSGIAVDLPVTLLKSSSVSAISLILDFPSELVEIIGVSMAENEVIPSWTVVGNELRIGWNSTRPMWINADQELLTIHLVTSKDFGQGDAIRFSLAGDPLNELADGNFEVIPGAIIGIDAVEFSAYGIGEPSDGNNVSLQARPNPFMDYTTITYGIPADGQVTLQISDLLGRVVSVPVNEYKYRGTYSYKLDVTPLQPGVYTATITLQSNGGDMVRTIKLIRK